MLLLMCASIYGYATDIVFKRGETIIYSIDDSSEQVVGTALRLFANDLKAVLGSELNK